MKFITRSTRYSSIGICSMLLCDGGVDKYDSATTACTAELVYGSSSACVLSAYGGAAGRVGTLPKYNSRTPIVFPYVCKHTHIHTGDIHIGTYNGIVSYIRTYIRRHLCILLILLLFSTLDWYNE